MIRFSKEGRLDIVKRAYLKIKEETETGPELVHIKPLGQALEEFHAKVRAEVCRLINARAYGGNDWPRELGPMPDELKSYARLRREQASSKGGKP